MNCHQILSGACNAGDRCFAVGSVEGIPFTAYAAGCNIVILASNFERVQIIPGATHGYIKISALDCSTDTGKISAAYESKVLIFEPTPVVMDKQNSHHLDYRWVQTGSFQSQSHVITLSWNLEGTRLLTGGTSLQLWKEKTEKKNAEKEGVTFVIGDRETKTPTNENQDDGSTWDNVWSCHTAIPIYHMAFSPDGTLFATCGRNDRLVKIWYENNQVLFPTQSSENSQEDFNINFSYIYIAHPRAVSNISWRKTSKYMPKGSVSNMIVTSCLDNICRIWIETLLPDDGLVNMTQFDPLVSQNPKFRTHRHKHRFMQRLKHMKTCFHIRRHAKNGTVANNLPLTSDGPNFTSPIPSLPSSCSVHDFHSYGFHGTGVSPGMHFHLAASINAETDIPLVPSMKSDATNQNHFILHWLNNKEMHFTLQAENILQEFTKSIINDDYSEDQGLKKHETSITQDITETQKQKLAKMSLKATSIDESNSDDYSSGKQSNPNYRMRNINSISNTTSLNSLVNDAPPVRHLADSLDIKIDCLLRDWHHSPDLLFSIHPVDGSYLIWVVEWLEDYYPGSFRQAQVSFSTRIPSAFPLGDAMSMSIMVSLFNTGSHPLYLREKMSSVKNKNLSTAKTTNVGCFNEEDVETEQLEIKQNMKSADSVSTEDDNNAPNDMSNNSVPTVSMVTKHSNGTLNLWQLTFAFKTKFTHVLSIGHVSRASGHRFRVNDISCHPVLPLLLSTSHHNLPEKNNTLSSQEKFICLNKDVFSPSGFCSELILWRVDAVGPLGHSGGVSELARINSPEISAFSNVAWIPTLLPSTTLGSYSNSPSACFVASDGENLRVYQAVIDARTLLAELSESENFINLPNASSNTSIYSNSSSIKNSKNMQSLLHEKIKVVSQQSTARPGCIIQLDTISEAKHDWQNTQFLHVFQAQLISDGLKEKHTLVPTNDAEPARGLFDTEEDAIVDLQQNAEFREPFFIVIIEKTEKGSTIHMWRIIISSKPQTFLLSESAMYVPDSNITQELDDSENVARKMSIEEIIKTNIEAPHITIETEKMCTQELPLPEGVDVVHASPAAGHLSSSSIYPACFAPYIIVTACSDSVSRFWKCEPITQVTDMKNCNSFKWSEWKMFSRQQTSAIEVNGQPLNISAAYSGRIACAYKYGKSFTRPNKGNPDSRYINLCVAIYECESTGGSEWVLEDTINLRNIYLPRMNVDHGIDLSYLHDNRVLQKKQRINQVIHTFTHDESRVPRSVEITPEQNSTNNSGLLAVPSFSTLQSLRKSIAENGNTCPLTQKHLVQLDWVSKEDGSHILTVAVGSKILLYTPVSSDIAQANIKAMKESRSANRPILRKASSLAQPHFNDEIRWMKLRQIDLKTADGLPPLPMQMSWVRDGILVVAMDSEMHVYSQWKPYYAQNYSVEDLLDSRNLRDENLRSITTDTTQLKLKSISSVPLMSKMSAVNLQYISTDKKKKGSLSTGNINSNSESIQTHDYMTDYGLFQASRIACPVLPQYHPKQLMELLNCGKIRWVKAILAHLVRCMSGPRIYGLNTDDEETSRQRSWSRSRTMSISYTAGTPMTEQEKKGSSTQIPEELMLDYAEITSIPPLPLWVLLTADTEVQGSFLKEDSKDYDDLFDIETCEDNLDDLLGCESDQRKTDRRHSLPEKQNLSHFGLRQGQVLSRLLTHTHLPGLSSLDQMHLLALADTVATCNKDFSEKFVNEPSKNILNKEVTGNIPTDSLDDCALRFLLAMKHFTYLLRCLPLNQRTQFQRQGIGTSNIVWAFHSESEEELLNLIPSYTKGDLKWLTLKELGVGYWLKNISILKKCVEKLAKCAYQARQDPLDAALYYLAMKKKSIVWGLYRSKRDDKMTTFFSNNFSEDRWRKAALKNAFVLLGKQRFEHAVAFFLLANSLNDAIEVCINKLEDFQLALVISRLYEGDLDISIPSSYYRLLNEHILGYNSENSTYENIKAHPDPFLRSIAFWILKRHSDSLNTLLENDVGQNHCDFKEEDIFKNESQSTNPNVFNFYIYLRTHPLLIRQHIAYSAQEKKTTQVVLSGFSYSGDKDIAVFSDKQLQIEDTITPLERQLYFTTAHGHFKAGCPALALEVLNKLPSKVMETNTSTETTPMHNTKEKLITTGILDWLNIKHPNINDTIKLVEETNKFPEKNDDHEMEFCEQHFSRKETSPKIDIMAQQLKFVACLKILMEELSTLATGFEVDGGQLRYQLYIWLEKEVDALKHLCNYCNADKNVYKELQSVEFIKEKDNVFSSRATEKPSLHEILILEKMEFDAKVMRAVRRKRWLKANETLLRTLLSYCSLHGAGGGGLASVRMELILLLQELQQEKSQQQLLSPLPFPTTLPLLSACVAGNKTVIADPIKFLQSQTQDILQCIVETSPLPGNKIINFCEIFALRDLSIALSSCIYQSLCDSESFVVNKTISNGYLSPGIENIAKLNSSYECSYLMGNTNIFNRKRKYSTDEPTNICTSPSKWPGVANLRALLAREKDEDIPKLNVLLLESFVATFMSLFVYALATCDSRILYRIIGQNFSNETWSTVFGGGIRKLLRKASSTVSKLQSFEETSDENSVWNAVTSITKQRVKLNMKLLGPFNNSTTPCHMKEDKPTYREQFVPPEMSMLSYLLSKPQYLDQIDEDDYDTDDPNESDDEEELFDEEGLSDNTNQTKSQIKLERENTEHSNPGSRSWTILRLALIKLSSKKLRDFINIAGIETQDLPVFSPLVHEVLRSLDRWQELVLEDLIKRGPAPQDYITGYEIDGLNACRQLLDKKKTPFNSSSCSGPVRRLWSFLFRNEYVQDIFVKFIFNRNALRANVTSSILTGMQSVEDGNDNDFGNVTLQNEPIRIIHKDHESIFAFCVNNNSPGQMAISNLREVQELDITLLLESPNWYEDEYDYDLTNVTKDMEPIQNSGFLVVHSQERNSSNISTYSSEPVKPYYTSPGWQSGRGSSLVLKHKIDNVKRMSSHPIMPLYLTGGQDGSVQIWEWGHQQVVCTPRPSGTFAKVTRCRFSEQGNKFGIADGDGNISLWQAGISSHNNRSFFNHQCHNKVLSDFVFLGSCSLIATAGQSSENKNVGIWDTLLPIKKAGVASFSCHDQGSSSLVFAPQHQILISCGKKGDVCIFDIRQRIIRHRYQAHDSAIKCVALDPNEEYFVTGSTEGDIKIWNLNNFSSLHVFPGEHSKNSFFKHTGQGVTQLHLDAFGRLFSCGSDGCMKVRQLIEKDTIVQTIY